MLEFGSQVLNRLTSLFFSPSSTLSISSLACALFIAAGFLIWKRAKRGQEVEMRVLLRALFPKRFFTKTVGIDVLLTVLNTSVFVAVFGLAIVNYNVVSSYVISGLVALFGTASPSALPEWQVNAFMTFALFMAFEFAYWFDHYLSHRIPYLWEFHRVHHEAEVLTPLTNFRVHPVDTIVFYNINGICLGLMNGVCSYAFGSNAHQFVLFDVNIFVVCALHLLTHLQHTHMWIAFTGFAGRVIMSPAHHQIHHSTNPKHFNTNLGGVLAFYDWLFGTLYIPGKTPEKLTFGVDRDAEHAASPHTMHGALIEPVIRVGKMIRIAIRKARRPAVSTLPGYSKVQAQS